MVYSIENGVLKINGTANKGTTIVLANNIFFKKGTYTHSINDIKSAMFFSFDNLSNTMLRVVSGTKIKNITFQLAEDTIFERYILWVDNGASFNNEKFYLQTEPNSTSTPYTPHKEQVFTFPLGNEKLMLGDYLADDGIHHVKGQVVFDGTEKFTAVSVGTNSYALNNVIVSKYDMNKLQIMSNYFKGIPAIDRNTDETVIYVSADNQFIIRNTSFNSITELKNWIAEQYANNTPLIVQYELAEEVIVPYTSAQQEVYNEIKNAYSYDEMTIITGSSDGNKPFFTVQAYKDLNKELNNKVDKVQGKELSSNDFTDTLKEKLEGLENYDDTEIKEDISDIQEEQVEQNTDIENLQEEQTEQNTEIEKLQTENTRLKATLPTTTGEGQDITLDKTAELEFKKPPLPMGNSEQNGEPAPDNEVPITNVTGDVEVVVENKNLFDEKNATVLYSNSASTIQSITGGIRVTSGHTSTSSFTTTKICDAKYLINNNLTVKGTWRGTNSGAIKIGYCDADGNNRVQLGNIVETSGISLSVTVPSNIEEKVLILWLYVGGNINGYVDYNVQVEYGSTATSYTPHQEQKFIFPLGNEKLMIGDYLADDGIHHVRGQVVLDGSENWLANGESTDYGQYVYLLNTKAYGTTNLISDKFLTKTGNNGNYISGRDANKYIAISIAKNIVTYGANQFKTWLSTHNTTVEYELEEEVIVPYTSAQQEVYNQIKQAYSYDEITIITGSSDGNKPFFTVQAYKDLNKELNNKVDKVQGKELSSNDFTDTLKEKLEGLENYDDTEIKADISDIQEEQTEQNTDIENLQEENARLKVTLPTTTGEGQDVTLDKTAEMEFVKPPLPMGNSEQNGEPRPDNEVFITNVTGNVEVTISNENNTESKTLPVSLGNIELCKLGNYQDYIYKNEGNWYVHKNIIKIDLSTITSYTHTSGWRNPTAFVADNVFNHEYSGYTTVASLFCNRLIADTPARITGSVINAIGLGRNSSMYMSVEGITTSNALITYFSQNPTYLYAPLATPTDTEITDTTLISQLEEISKTLSYQGQTNITSNTIALFNVEAYQSTKLVLEEMATAIVALGGV